VGGNVMCYWQQQAVLRPHFNQNSAKQSIPTQIKTSPCLLNKNSIGFELAISGWEIAQVETSDIHIRAGRNELHGPAIHNSVRSTKNFVTGNNLVESIMQSLHI